MEKNRKSKMISKLKIIIIIIILGIVSTFGIYFIIANNNAKEYNDKYVKYKGNQDYTATRALLAYVELANYNEYYGLATLFDDDKEDKDYTMEILFNGKDVTGIRPDTYLNRTKQYNIKFNYEFFSRKINKIIINEK